MKIIFIAGPYFSNGNLDKIEENIRCAESYQIALANNGIGFFCPHNHTEHFEKKSKASEDFYRELDMLFLKQVANAVLALPDWKNSKGARAEIKWAKKNKIKVFFPNSPDDLDDIIKWSKK